MIRDYRWLWEPPPPWRRRWSVIDAMLLVVVIGALIAVPVVFGG